MDEEEMIRKIAVLLGGRAAEKIFLKSVSTGAADDLVKATDLARSMVTRFGMSDPIGLSSLEDKDLVFLESPFLGRNRPPYSEETAKQIDREVKNFLERGLRLAVNQLNHYQDFVRVGAERIIEKETLNEEDIAELWEELGLKVFGTTPYSEKVAS